MEAVAREQLRIFMSKERVNRGPNSWGNAGYLEPVKIRDSGVADPKFWASQHLKP
jgi:hypothetical protein